jgi:uncharacterized membrane-anchored protein
MKPRVALLALATLLQLAVPAWMIVGSEMTLRHGRAFRLLTAPVDPYDAFRGRYVALRFEIENTKRPPGFPDTGYRNSKQQVYIALGEDADGFAKVEKVSLESLSGDNVFTAFLNWTNKDNLHLAFPFDHYYMEESAAPQAEVAYRDNSRRGNQKTWAVVRVRNGRAVIEELFIDGKPVREFLRDHPKQ